jgi:Tol biopolymer transport system component
VARRLPSAALLGWSHDERLAFLKVVHGRRLVAVELGDRFGRRPTELGRLPYDDHGIEGAAWLPDGSGLLYAWSARAQHDLWAVDAAGSRLRRLTTGDRDIESPAWSADGSRLAFASASFGGGNCGFCDPQIVVADAAGKQLAVVPLATDNSGDFAPSWGPNGKQLVVEHCCSGELDVVDLATGRRRMVATGTMPTWSPDGSRIAFAASGGVGAVDSAGSHSRTLLAPQPLGAEITGIAWSHDGRQLAVATSKGLLLVSADGKVPPRTILASPASRPSFSPDGAWLAFAAPPTHGAPSDIFVIAVDGSGSHAVASSPADDTAPAWRPSP